MKEEFIEEMKTRTKKLAINSIAIFRKLPKTDEATEILRILATARKTMSR